MTTSANTFDLIVTRAGENPQYGKRLSVRTEVIPLSDGYRQLSEIGMESLTSGAGSNATMPRRPGEPNWLTIKEHEIKSDKPNDYAARFVEWLRDHAGPDWNIRIEE
jgi:hypothetical protein